MFGTKTMSLGGQVSQPSSPPRSQRRPPSTPPLPLRRLQLMAKQPETLVVLRGGKKVKGHRSGVRDSWPCTGLKNPNAEACLRTTRQSQPHLPQSLPVRALPPGRGSDATMMSLLMFCHSNSLNPIDNKIEQAMDLVKSHLLLAVREQVELLRERIRDLQEKNQQLERENRILRALTHSAHSAI
ncbi:uncharacterized protein LOC121202159 isoform X1 [Betta splendens]|uniref:Uncharacterized protein LOC121202159 isoform X1 n=1 Tax=Betta splendens TaxID=158456 RepID=A0A8M1HCS5_BETSP|nr:uncharacterized protein LOC121202159 isoform X1 [Betta splendens]